MGKRYLNIAHYAPNITVLGPGKRIAIWMQGCLQECPDCIEPNWRPLSPAQMITVEDFAQYAFKHASASGITLSGGEPMLQAEGLVELWLLLKAELPSWNLITFTGYTRNQLLEHGNPYRISLMNESDLLIAGPYVGSLNDGTGLRGSNNQEFYFKKDSAFTPEERHEIMFGPRKHEIHVGAHQIVKAGIP